jgi:hypothetical protein
MAPYENALLKARFTGRRSNQTVEELLLSMAIMLSYKSRH